MPAIGDLRDWLIVGQIIGTALLFVGLIWLRSLFVPRKEFEAAMGEVRKRVTAQSERLNAGEARFDRLDDRLRDLPVLGQRLDTIATNLHELVVALEKLSGDVRVTNERLDGLSALHETLQRQVGLIDDFMRSHR